jgi:ATP-dependent Clp protease adaptor protein ClpS
MIPHNRRNSLAPKKWYCHRFAGILPALSYAGKMPANQLFVDSRPVHAIIHPARQTRSQPRLNMSPISPIWLLTQTVIDPVVDEADDLRLEPLYRVLIHNDDVTPYDYVVRILQRVFLLSEELADHVAWTAHHEEVAVVVVRPRPEAEKLIMVARGKARLDGYPLTFTMEPDD